MAFLGGFDGIESSWNAEDQVQSLGWEDPQEKETATTTVFLPGELHG